VREDKKKRVREEWQKQLKITEEEKKREEKIQFNQALTKTLVQQGGANTAVAKKVLKVLRRELTREELDQEFRELNAGQVGANARLAVEELVVPRGVNKKEKSAAVWRRMMRAEEEVGETNKLPPVSVLLNRGDAEVREREVENVQAVKPRVGKKVINVPTSVIEEMELYSGGEDVDFEREQKDEVRVEIP